MTGITKTSVSALDALLEGCSKAVITSHIHPDGDAVGCCTAMLSYMKGVRGVEASVVLADQIPDNLEFIVPEEYVQHVFAGKELLARSLEEIASADLVICLDAAGFSRTGALEEALRKNPARRVLIDHHVGPEAGDFNVVFSTNDISSASELLYWVLMEMPETGGDPALLPPDAAYALMAGMTTDTNNFANSVYPSTMEMASSLIASGVDRDWLLEMLYNRYRENRIRMMGWLLSENMEITPEGAAVMIAREEDLLRYDMREGETDGFVNIPLAIAQVRMSMLIKEEDGLFRVSLRSKQGTSAREFATRYCGGGGHELAAGGRIIPGKDIAGPGELESYIHNALKEFLK